MILKAYTHKGCFHGISMVYMVYLIRGMQVEKAITIILRNELYQIKGDVESHLYNIDFNAIPRHQDGKYHLLVRPYVEINGFRFQTTSITRHN
jgi:hypothetical protein